MTRSSSRDDIFKFLEMKGVKDVAVHTVKKGKSKADVICDPTRPAWTGEGGQCVLFVDDSIVEHVDKRLQAAPGVHRVLFTRGIQGERDN